MEVPHVPALPDLRFRIRLRTRWSDEDNHGVLNNAVYLTLLEEARLAYFTHLGLMRAARFPFVLLQTNARFLRPGRGGAEVEVALATTHLGRSSFTQAYRMGPAGEDLDSGPWCVAEALLVTVDGDHASVPMDASFRDAISAFEGALRPNEKGK